MRSRLTLAFGLLGVIVVATFILFRAVTITDLAEDDVRRQVQREALVTATLLGQGRPPTSRRRPQRRSRRSRCPTARSP